MEIELLVDYTKSLIEQYKHITKTLDPYKDNALCSIEFIVEKDENNKKIVTIQYPGKFAKRRKLKRPQKKSLLWEYLYDFYVVPYNSAGGAMGKNFTWYDLLKDFELNKIDNTEFWDILKNLYENKIITNEFPKTKGIDSRLFLLSLRWMWYQEDLNYRYTCEDIGSPTKYQNTTKGVGRTKFFAALVLSKNGFKTDEIQKIVGLY